ncbi:MAG: efflux RND transporter periplasmic adaptor subunit [Bacteroidia bacterium]
MRTAIKITLGLILFGIFAWTLWFLYQKNQEKPVMYETGEPFITDIVQKTVATGSVVPRKEIEIKPQVSGIVDKIYVQAGEQVKTGDVIARVKIIPDMVNLNNAESRENRAKLALQNAERDFNRSKTLYEQKAISQAEYQQMDLALKNAREEMEAASNNLQLIRQGSTSRSGSSSNTLIRSTIEGMVLDVPVEEGNSVIESNTFNEGTTIATVADMNEMVFEGKVDESEVGKIKPGMDLILTIGAIEGLTYPARLEYISPKGVDEEGAIKFEIKAAIALEEGQFLRANYSATAYIVLDKRDSVLAIQESLLLFEGDQAFVEVATGNQEYEKRSVKLGLSDGIKVEVLEGVQKGEKLKDRNKIVEAGEVEKS